MCVPEARLTEVLLTADAQAAGTHAGRTLYGRLLRLLRAHVLDGLIVTVLGVGVITLVPTVVSAPTVSASDSGVFYSVFHQLAQGRRLYVDVFDHKDPLFYAPYTVAYVLVGLSGPMLWETIVSLALVGAMVLLAARLGVPAYARLPLVAGFAVLHFLPEVYVPLHTYHQGIVLVVVSLAFAASGRPRLAGVLVGTAIMTKLPVAALLPAVILLAAVTPRRRCDRAGGEELRMARWPTPAALDLESSWRERIKRALAVIAGVVATTLFVLGLLLVRGELGGYVDALLQNLAYPALNPAGVSSFKTGSTLWDRASSVFTLPLAVTYLALLAVSVAILVEGVRGSFPRRVTPETRAALLALSVAVGAVTMLQTASWWSQHFAVTGLAFGIAVVPALLLANRLAKPLAVGMTLLLFVVVGWLLATPSLAGKLAFQPPFARSADICAIVMRSGRKVPPRQECNVVTDAWPAGTRFATIQQNNPGSLAAWTPAQMDLACRVFYQFPWFRPELQDEIVDCLEQNDIDVVFRGPLSYDLPRIQKRIDGVLRRNFRLVRRYDEIEVWQRR